jgi:hypothetical protein
MLDARTLLRFERNESAVEWRSRYSLIPFITCPFTKLSGAYRSVPFVLLAVS